MKFLCKTADLLRTLTLVNRAIGSQHALPILGNVLLEVEGKRCRVSATDLELSIVTYFEGEIENEGAITVPAKAFLNFAQYSDDKEVLIETSEGTQLKLTSKQAKTVIAGEPPQEYPTIVPIEKETSFPLEVDPLLKTLHMVTFASAKTTLRPVLSGVYIRAEKGGLMFVATDSYRLSECKMETETSGSDVTCIVPTKVLEELRSILSSRKTEEGAGEKEAKKPLQTIDVALSSQQIEFRVGQTVLLSRLIEGKFPDYKQIIPTGTRTTVQLPARELVTVVKRMHYFAKEINNNLTCTLTKNSLHMATPPTQTGRDESTLAVNVEGDRNKIALSSAYLLDFLSHLSEETVELRLTDSMHPAAFRVPGNATFLHLIMPLRIQEEVAVEEKRGKGEKKEERKEVVASR